MEINHSIALKHFKKEIGQANHMLITIMVGLDGIVPYNIEAKDEFHTSWNPKSKKRSVDRSKVFAKKAALVWLVDCLDMYLHLINQSPILIDNENLKNDLDDDKNSRSVYRRVELMSTHYNIQSTDFALVDLLICWRNRLTHFRAENDITEQSKRILQNNSDEIMRTHCGLCIEQTLASFNKHNSPSFKEVTSFVRASINWVSEVDKKILHDIDWVSYSDRIIVTYLNDVKNCKTEKERKEKIARRLNNIFSKDAEYTEKSVRQILFQYGFTSEKPNDVDEFCKMISHLSFQNIKNCATRKSFAKGPNF